MTNSHRLELIEEMLEKNPEDTFLNYAAALELKKVGKLAQASGILEKVIERDPNYLASYYQLGKIYEAVEDLEMAIEVYKKGKILAREKNDVKALGELSEALLILDADDEMW